MAAASGKVLEGHMSKHSSVPLGCLSPTPVHWEHWVGVGPVQLEQPSLQGRHTAVPAAIGPEADVRTSL